MQPRTPVDTNELIRESVAILRGELESARIIVRLELAKELMLISVDSGQLRQVFVNLITNAADAMRGYHGSGASVDGNVTDSRSEFRLCIYGRHRNWNTQETSTASSNRFYHEVRWHGIGARNLSVHR